MIIDRLLMYFQYLLLYSGSSNRANVSRFNNDLQYKYAIEHFGPQTNLPYCEDPASLYSFYVKAKTKRVITKQAHCCLFHSLPTDSYSIQHACAPGYALFCLQTFNEAHGGHITFVNTQQYYIITYIVLSSTVSRGEETRKMFVGCCNFVQEQSNTFKVFFSI